MVFYFLKHFSKIRDLVLLAYLLVFIIQINGINCAILDLIVHLFFLLKNFLNNTGHVYAISPPKMHAAKNCLDVPLV